MLRRALPLLLLALLPIHVHAEDAEVVLSRPLVSNQVFPWPIRGDVGKCFVDEEGMVWMPTTLGEVARLDWRKAKADPEDPEAWTVFDLGEDLWLTSVHGIDGKVWVVGRTDGWRGVVFEWDGDAWRGVYLGDRFRCGQLYDVIAISPEEVHATGYADSAVGLRFDGARWSETDAGEAKNLYRFLMTESRGLLASGSLGWIYRFEKSRWVEYVEFPGRAPLAAVALAGESIFVGTAYGNAYEWDGEEVRDISPGEPVTGIQSVALLGSSLYAVDYKCRIHVREEGAWRMLEFPEPLASPNNVWTGAHLTPLDDETLLIAGSRGLVSLLSGGNRTDLSFGWRPTGKIATHIPPDGEFCIVATQHLRQMGGADPGYVLIANREQIQVLRAPTNEPAAGVFGRSEDEIYLLTGWGRVHRFDGTRWAELTEERLTPDWRRVGFPPKGTRGRVPEFTAIHAPEPGVVFVANPLFRYRDGEWEQLDLPDAFRPKHVPFDPESVEPGVFPPQSGWRGHWEWPQITSFAGTSAVDLRLETTKYPLRFDGQSFERVARRGPFAGLGGGDSSKQPGTPWSGNPFYLHRRHPDPRQWVRIQR